MDESTRKAMRRVGGDFLLVCALGATLWGFIYYFGASSKTPKTPQEKRAMIERSSREEVQPGTYTVVSVSRQDIPGFQKIVVYRTMPNETSEQGAYLGGLAPTGELFDPGEIVDVSAVHYTMNELGRTDYFLAVRKKKTTATNIGR